MNAIENGFLIHLFVNHKFLENNLVEERLFFESDNKFLFKLFLEFLEKNNTFDLLLFSDICKKNGLDTKLKDMIDIYDNDELLPLFYQAIIDNWQKKSIAKISDDLKLQKISIAKFDEIKEKIMSRYNLKISENKEKKIDCFTKVIYNKNLLKDNLLKSNFKSLDKSIKLLKGDITVITGQTSTGKSTFGMNILTKMCLEKKYSGIYFDFEMTTNQVLNRILASVTEIETNKFSSENYDFNTNEKKKINFQLDKIKNSDLDLVSNRDFDIFKVKNYCQSKKKLDFIVIDLIDKLENDEASDLPNYLKLKNSMVQLSKLAQNLNIHIFIVAQLNRASKNETISSENIAGSSSIEQTASNVLIFKRDRSNEDEEIKREVDLIIDKSRHGRTGKIPYHLELEISKVCEKN